MTDKLKEGGKKFDVFNTMQAATADETNVDILAKGEESKTKVIHNALLAAGFVPGLGNVADVADATLYALEGEFGEAAWSLASAIPVIGQMVAGKRALKAAKKAGEEMVTLYRGVDKWHPGKMVKDRKFVGAGAHGSGFDPGKNTLWTSRSRDYVEHPRYVGQDPGRITLEFEVPKSYVNKLGKETGQGFSDIEPAMETFFEEGLPVEFLKKVHKMKDINWLYLSQ